MKKIFALCLTFTMLFNLAACGDSSADKDTSNSEVIEVDEGLLNVEVTLPVSYVDGQTPEEIKANADKMGYSDCTIHEDGSVTYKMSKSKHKEVLDSFKKSFDESIAESIATEDGVVKEIKYNDNLSNIDVYLDKARYNEWNSFSVFGYYTFGSYYQVFAGSDAKEIDVKVNIIDAETKETIDSFSLSDMVDEEE